MVLMTYCSGQVTDANVTAFANVVSINPWNGRVYIVTVVNQTHFIRFKLILLKRFLSHGQKHSGMRVKQVVQLPMDMLMVMVIYNTYLHGKPIARYQPIWYIGANGDLEYSISYDYDTEKPKYIAHCSKYAETYSSYSGHNVEFIPFSEDWM